MDKPFKILQSYLRTINKEYTQEKIAECLKVSHSLVKQWCTRKYTTGSASSEDIFYAFFDEPSISSGFLFHLENLGYKVPERLYSLLSESDQDFIIFLGEFLLGNIKKSEHITSIDEPMTPTNKARSQKKYIGAPRNYFEQLIYKEDTDERVFMISSSHEHRVREFKKIDDLERILIVAPGGQGKSLFLRMLEEKALENKRNEKHYENVIRIELTELFSLSHNEIVSNSKEGHVLGYLIKHESKNEEYKSFLEKKEQTSNDETAGRILLLLDGLNELSASSDFKKVNAILDELEYINKNWTNTTIIMTTRPAKDNKRTLSGYFHCKLSGTPQEKLTAFLSSNEDVSEEIKSLAEIPMYYNILAKTKNTEKVKTKYDLLFRIYLERYNQSPKDGDSFFAFYVLAPYIAQTIHDNSRNKITLVAAKTIAEKLEKTNYELFLQMALNECGLGDLLYEPNLSNACSILFHNGPIKYVINDSNSPFVFSNDEYKIFHDDIRDFLLAFQAIITIKVMRASLEEGQFDFIKDICLNLNLKDEPTELIKSKLMISTGKDIEQSLSELYSALDEVPISPQSIVFAHTLFLISDYLNLGESAVEPTHKILIRFTNRIVRLVKQNNFFSCLSNNNENFGQTDQQRCIDAMLDIISKHCEYYRRNEMFVEGIELANIAERIQSNNDAITNQKGKLLLLMYQSHMKDSKEYELAKLGFNDYTELYFESRRVLDEAVKHDFNLSVNLVAMLYSVPAPFLFEDKSNLVAYDFVKAFDLCRSLIFTKQKKNYTAKEICYAVRQAVGLLIKGYVKFNPEFEKYEKGDPGKNSVIIGDRNTLLLDVNTLKLAEELLDKAEGMSLATLNYYRGILSFYKGDLSSAEKHFENESDTLLKSIFQYYRFGIEVDLDSLYQNIFCRMKETKRDAVDSCHPIYWYCDAKNLELSFNKKRSTYFEEFEKELPKTWKSIVKQLTQ